MLCRNLVRYWHTPKLLNPVFIRTAYFDIDGRNLQNRVLHEDDAVEMPVKKIRLHYSRENEYVHKLLASNKLYVNTIAFLDYLRTPDDFGSSVNHVLSEKYHDKPAYVLLCYLKVILKSAQDQVDLIQNPAVLELCEVLRSKVSELADEYLWNLMKVLTLWPMKEESQMFFDLCKAIDEDAVRRNPKWSYDQVLLTIDHFYRLNTLRFSHFSFTAMARLWRNPGKLTPQQVVHAMFLVNASRIWHPSVDMLDVESVLMFYIYDLSVEEIAVFAIAFFKTRKRVHNADLIEMMYNKLENRVDNLGELSLVAYLKFFRLCQNDAHESKTKLLLDKLTNRIDKLSNQSCLHVALLGSSRLYFHPPSLQKICEKFYNNMESLRLKDLERLSLVLQLFNFTPDNKEDILERIRESLHNRETEIMEKPKCFLSAIYYLSLGQCYDYELINKGLSIPFLKRAWQQISEFSIPSDLVHLSVGVRLECPDYKGNYFGELFIDQFCKKHCFIPDGNQQTLSQSWADLFSIQNILSMIFGSNKYVRLMYLLPYSVRAVVLFCIKDKQPVEIPQNFFLSDYQLPQPLPDLGGTWYAVVLLSRWNIVKQTSQPIGSVLSEFRHLKLLGCEPIQVLQTQYEVANKTQYMKDVIHKLTG